MGTDLLSSRLAPASCLKAQPYRHGPAEPLQTGSVHSRSVPNRSVSIKYPVSFPSDYLRPVRPGQIRHHASGSPAACAQACRVRLRRHGVHVLRRTPGIWRHDGPRCRAGARDQRALINGKAGDRPAIHSPRAGFPNLTARPSQPGRAGATLASRTEAQQVCP